jgi:hypothetical protein
MGTDSQANAREEWEDRLAVSREQFEDLADARRMERARKMGSKYSRRQAEYSSNYPDADQPRTPPSEFIQSSSSGVGYGSGSGSSSRAGPQAESSRARHVRPGHPLEQMEIEDPEVISYPAPTAHGRRSGSFPDQGYQLGPDLEGGYDDQIAHPEMYDFSQGEAARRPRHQRHEQQSSGCCVIL